MKQKTFHAWAIYINEEPYGLIGQYWQFGAFADVPVHMRGTRITLFETRKIARKHLQAVKPTFKKAKVVKVSVALEWER